MDHPAYQAIKTPLAPAGSQGQTPPVPESPSPIATENPAQPTPPAQPAKPSSKNWKKWLVIGGILLVILLTGTAYVLSQQESKKTEPPAKQSVSKPTPTPDPTADWKTYTNTKYGYSIKYPENTKIDTSLDAAITFSRNTTPKPSGGGQGICCGMTIYLRPYGYIVNPSVSKNIIINSYAAKIVNHATYNHSIYIDNPDKTSTIDVSISTGAAIKPYDKEDFQTFNQMLSTLKFTKLSPSFSTREPKLACEQSGGKWLAQYNECEASSGGLDEKTCKELGGVHKACDSACRHDPNAQGCIEVCINVCKF
jgi:hypothetical protein